MQLSRLGFIRAFIESVGPSIRCGVSGALPSRYTVDDRARSDSGSGVRLPRPPARAWTPHRTAHGRRRAGRGLGGRTRGGATRRGTRRCGAMCPCAVTLGAGGRGRRADRGLPRAESRPVRVRSESPIDRVKR